MWSKETERQIKVAITSESFGIPKIQIEDVQLSNPLVGVARWQATAIVNGRRWEFTGRVELVLNAGEFKQYSGSQNQRKSNVLDITGNRANYRHYRQSPVQRTVG